MGGRGPLTVILLLVVTFLSAVIMLAGARCIDAGEDPPPPAPLVESDRE